MYSGYWYWVMVAILGDTPGWWMLCIRFDMGVWWISLGIRFTSVVNWNGMSIPSMQTKMKTEVKIEIEEIEVKVELELEKRWRCGESGVGSGTC